LDTAWILTFINSDGAPADEITFGLTGIQILAVVSANIRWLQQAALLVEFVLLMLNAVSVGYRKQFC
jgi:hypothetical protein